MSTLRQPQPVIDVAQHLVRLAATCMATHDIRYYLNGVLIEPREAGGVFIVATDGHRLMAVIDETGSASESAILSLDKSTVARMVRPDAKSNRPADSRHVINEKAGYRLQTDVFRDYTAVLLTDNAGMVTHVRPRALIEGKFPEWRRVIPDFEKLKPGLQSMFNPDYLGAPIKAFKGRRPPSATPYQVDAQGAIIWHLHGHEHALLLIMPWRGDTGTTMHILAKNWSPDARRPRRPADPPPQDPVAVPAERDAAAQGGEAATGAQPAAASEAAQPPAQGPAG